MRKLPYNAIQNQIATMQTKRILLLAGALIWMGMAWGQSAGIPFIQNYKSRLYKASSANYGVVQDARGIMYFANFRGVLEYDGVQWRLFPLPNGAAVRSLAVDSLGTVYVGGAQEMGLLEPDSLGRLRYRSLLPLIDTTSHRLPERIEVMGDIRGAWFRGFDEGQLYRWNGEELLHYPTTHTGPGNSMFLIGGQLLVQNSEEGLLRWEKEHFVPVAGGEKLQGFRFTALTPMGKGKLLGFDRGSRSDHGKGFVMVDIANNWTVRSWPTEIAGRIQEYFLSGMFALRDGNLIVSTVKSGCFLLDSEGRILQHLTDESGLQDNLVLGAYQDRQGNLWLALSKGISRVDLSAPLTQWGESSGLKGIVFNAIHHQNRLYAATTLGIFVQKGNRFVPVKGPEMETWTLTQAESKGRLHLLASTPRGLMEIHGESASLLRGGRGLFKTVASGRMTGHVLALSAIEGVEVLYHDGQRWRFREDQRLPGRFNNMVETSSGEVWLQELLHPLVLHRYLLSEDSILFSSHRTFRLPDSFPVPQGLHLWRGELALATDKGIYLFDQATEQFYPETLLGISGENRQTGVLRIVEDREQRLWIERYLDNRRWLEVAAADSLGHYTRDSISLRDISDLEIWSEVYLDPAGNAWIGTPEGLFAFNTRAPRRKEAVFRPLIRQVVAGADSVLYYGFAPADAGIPELPYQNNAITFQFAAPSYKSESEVLYSYYLEGWDKAWSHWKAENKKDYTLLPPGEYVFRVKARNPYGQESVESTYTFRIAAPWYRSPWAFFSYAFLIGAAVYGTVKLNTRRLHIQNEHLERIVFERTSEIWAQHKEIIRKTAELKRQKEAIASQHDLLEEKNQALESTLSQLKSAQSKLVESEKMASLGQLTAGIAHEINNPINFVKGNVGPLKRDFSEIRGLFEQLYHLNPGQDPASQLAGLRATCKAIDAPFLFEEMASLLSGIEEGAQRTKQIVDGLKVFARSDTDTLIMADVHQSIESTLTLLSNNLKDRFEIHRAYAKLPQIECMPGKLNQVFMNILSNAVQAIEAATPEQLRHSKQKIGDIWITTRDATLNRQPAIQIDFRDSGPGIPPDIRSRIFDPFFTTKDIGQGTGLGLSISFGIIEKHKGTIEVLEAEPNGALFRITLPREAPKA